MNYKNYTWNKPAKPIKRKQKRKSGCTHQVGLKMQERSMNKFMENFPENEIDFF